MAFLGSSWGLLGAFLGPSGRPALQEPTQAPRQAQEAEAALERAAAEDDADALQARTIFVFVCLQFLYF